jgi:hypothetical protein
MKNRLNKGDYPTARKALALLIEERAAMKSVMRRALTDIDYLLQEGFDTNIDDCVLHGVSQTISDLKDQLEERPFEAEKED